jgi:hypothetical protein
MQSFAKTTDTKMTHDNSAPLGNVGSSSPASVRAVCGPPCGTVVWHLAVGSFRPVREGISEGAYEGFGCRPGQGGILRFQLPSR